MTGRLPAGRTAIALGAIAVAVASVVPVVYLFATGISLRDVREQFRYPSTLAAVWQTIGLTVSISALTVALGVGCALLVVRTTIPFPRLFTVLFALPLAIPGFVSAYAAYSTELVYAPRLSFTTSFAGASVVIALSLYPYIFLPCVVGLRRVDPSLEEVVASLRPHRASVIWRVITPELRPAIATGVLIVALHVVAEYGAMVQLGRSTLTTKIMAEMLDYGDYRSARSLSLVLGVLSIILLVATHRVAGRSRAGDVVRPALRPPRRWSLGRLRVPITLASLAVPLAAAGPTVFMTVRGLAHSAARHGQQGGVVDWGQVGTATSTTAGYALAAAAVATVVAAPVSWRVVRRPSLTSTLTERAVWVAHAIPGAILALALVYLVTRVAPSQYKSATVLVAAYVVLFLPLAVANQSVGLTATRTTYDDVAASLGARPATTLRRVTLPLVLPGFVAGALLVGLDASKELTTTLMLIPYNAHTLSTRLWATTNGESLDFTAAAPYAAMLVALGSIPVYLLVRQTLRQLADRPASAGRAQPKMPSAVSQGATSTPYVTSSSRS